MQQDLDVVDAVAWSSADATPMRSLTTLMLIARERYAMLPSMIRMNRQAIVWALATSEVRTILDYYCFRLPENESQYPSVAITCAANALGLILKCPVAVEENQSHDYVSLLDGSTKEFARLRIT